MFSHVVSCVFLYFYPLSVSAYPCYTRFISHTPSHTYLPQLGHFVDQVDIEILIKLPFPILNDEIGTQRGKNQRDSNVH